MPFKFTLGTYFKFVFPSGYQNIAGFSNETRFLLFGETLCINLLQNNFVQLALFGL